METTIAFECWIYGHDPDILFKVNIPLEETIGSLKKAIIMDNPVEFRDVGVTELHLYSIPYPKDEHFEDELKKWKIKDKNRLNSRTRVSRVQGCLIIVNPPSPEITLNCWVLGQGRNVLSVKISNGETVGILGKAIKDDRPEDFRNTNVDSLALYKVSLANDETLENVTLDDKHPLDPVHILSHVFPEAPSPGCIHIAIKVRDKSNAYSTAVPASAIHPRMKYIQAWASNDKSPSHQGEPSNFKALQSTECRIEWTRPPGRGFTIPVTLLHPAFGQFVHDCQNYEPTGEDNSLVLELCHKMSEFFEREKERQEAIMGIFRSHGLGIVPSCFSGYTTDGDMHVNGRRYMILEVKNELGSKGAEPYCQAILYYLGGIKGEVENAFENNLLFNFPCLIATLFGPHLSFSGAVWADRPSYQVLSSALPLFSHLTDLPMRRLIARHIGAFRKACRALKEVYERFDHMPIDFRDMQPEFPHPRFYTSLDSEDVVHFKYIRVLEERKLLFVVETNAGEQLCVKFTQTYSLAVHQQCADWGISPLLRGHNDIPGGWQMVTMDLLKDHQCLHEVKRSFSRGDKERLREELGSRLMHLHQMNLVHGDVRDANIMISRDRSGWKLVDFDWSGEIGKVQYPMNVNRGPSLRRPEGATDGELVLADHDMRMLGYLF